MNENPQQQSLAIDLQQSRFLRACRGEPVDATPIWLMRQAGRYMSEYRDLRKQHSTLAIAQTPELACEATMQPIKAFDLDAAIIFSDILPPLEGMGLRIEILPGKGPIVHDPVRTPAEIAALRTPPAEEALAYTMDAIRLTRAELDPRGVPLIGFCASPLTLAAYAVAGGKSKNDEKLKSLMMTQPDAWHDLMSKLAQVVGGYLRAQGQAGAQALQLFEKMTDRVTPDDYRQHVLPYSQQALAIAAEAGVPIIHFAAHAPQTLLADLRAAGGEVIGVDWRIELRDALAALGPDVPLQGNLDPVALLTTPEMIETRTRTIIDAMVGHPHIFNVGEGILRQTPVEHVQHLVDFVHTYSHRSEHERG